MRSALQHEGKMFLFTVTGILMMLIEGVLGSFHHYSLSLLVVVYILLLT